MCCQGQVNSPEKVGKDPWHCPHPLPTTLCHHLSHSLGDQSFIFDPETSRARLEGAGFEIKDVMAGIPDEELDPFLVNKHPHAMPLVQKQSTRKLCPPLFFSF
jgi:hypothetical protein